MINARTSVLVLAFMSIFTFSFSVGEVKAQAPANITPSCYNSFFGLPTWYQYLNVIEVVDSKTNRKTCSISSGQANIPALIILGIIAIAIRLAGILAVFMIIWGGYKFIFSDGSSDQVAGARKTILNAVIGLIIVILATPLVNFIAGRLS